MSAHLVGRAHIDALVSYAERLGDRLTREPLRSLADRANDDRWTRPNIGDDPTAEALATVIGRDTTPSDILGRILWAENRRSVYHRYRGDADMAGGVEFLAEIVQYRAPGRPQIARSPVEIIKLCNGLAYQSCERDGWEQSLACQAINSIRDAAMRALPGYEDADWTL